MGLVLSLNIHVNSIYGTLLISSTCIKASSLMLHLHRVVSGNRSLILYHVPLFLTTWFALAGWLLCPCVVIGSQMLSYRFRWVAISTNSRVNISLNFLCMAYKMAWAKTKKKAWLNWEVPLEAKGILAFLMLPSWFILLYIFPSSFKLNLFLLVVSSLIFSGSHQAFLFSSLRYQLQVAYCHGCR